MKRVLHVIDSLSCGSGMMSFIMNYYRNIDRKKIQFDFLYYSDSKLNFEKEIVSLGGNCYKISKPSLSIAFFKEVSDFLKRNSKKYMAIHCHPIFSSSYISLFKKKYNINHIIQHSHTSQYSSHLFGKIRNKIFLYLADHNITEYVACSPEALLLFPKKSIKHKKNIIINNSIDYDKFTFSQPKRDFIRKKLSISKNTIVMGHVGRFSKEKNHSMLIDIFNSYHKKNANSILLLVGDGSLKSQIIEKIKKDGLDDVVIFVGRVKDVENYYSAMDIFVFPSIFEGFGLSAIEAQVNGLLCVVSNNVPKCVKISNRIFYCDDIKDYINIIEKNKLILKNINRNDIIIDKKYDCSNNVEILEKFYLNLDN